MKQLIKYPGSKWRLSDWIISFFPAHHSYLEPYLGSGAVLFNKSPSKIETVNDLDGEVCNLFDCIKRNPEKLAEIIYLMPYARDTFDDSYNINIINKYERAAAFMARCDMGHGFRANGEKTGFKIDIQGRESAYAVKRWNKLPDSIIQAAQRLKEVQIENRDAISIIQRFNHENVLMYLDPPYMLSTRHGKQYKKEMTDKDHQKLLDTINASKAKIIISGYENAIYDEALKNWHKEERTTNQKGKVAKEILWMNFEPTAQIEMK